MLNFKFGELFMVPGTIPESKYSKVVKDQNSRVRVDFVNASDAEVIVYWIHYSGELKGEWSLKPGGKVTFSLQTNSKLLCVMSHSRRRRF